MEEEVEVVNFRKVAVSKKAEETLGQITQLDRRLNHFSLSPSLSPSRATSHQCMRMHFSSLAQQQHQQHQSATARTAAAAAAATAASSKAKASGSKHLTAALLCAFVASGLALPYFLSKSGVGVRFSFEC